MQTDPPAGVSASPVADNVMTWYVGRSEGIRLCQLADEKLGMPSSSALPILPLRMEPFV